MEKQRYSDYLLDIQTICIQNGLTAQFCVASDIKTHEHHIMKITDGTGDATYLKSKFSEVGTWGRPEFVIGLYINKRGLPLHVEAVKKGALIMTSTQDQRTFPERFNEFFKSFAGDKFSGAQLCSLDERIAREAQAKIAEKNLEKRLVRS